MPLLASIRCFKEKCKRTIILFCNAFLIIGGGGGGVNALYTLHHTYFSMSSFWLLEVVGMELITSPRAMTEMLHLTNPLIPALVSFGSLTTAHFW